MQKITVRRIVLGSILLCMSLFAMFALFFDVLRLNVSNGVGAALKAVGYSVSDNGFAFACGNSIFVSELNEYRLAYYIAGLDGLNVTCRVFNIIFIVAAAAAIVLTVLWFFFGRGDVMARVALGLSAAVACGYMVMGIITRTAVVESYTYALMSNYELDEGVVGMVLQLLADALALENRTSIKRLVASNIHTYAYVPMIIIGVLIIAYYTAAALLKSAAKNEENGKVKAAEAETVNVESSPAPETDFDRLRELKKLFDDGVLTEEEFVEQKSLVLGKRQ